MLFRLGAAVVGCSRGALEPVRGFRLGRSHPVCVVVPPLDCSNSEKLDVSGQHSFRAVDIRAAGVAGPATVVVILVLLVLLMLLMLPLLPLLPVLRVPVL